MKRWFILLILLFTAASALAGESKPLGEDPALEARLKNISQELRCLVCQNSTLADSNAPLAEDLRREIRSLMREGKSDKEVVEYLVARYGDFVLYRPPVNSNTALLWFGPFLFLLVGGFVLYKVLKKQAAGEDIEPEDV
jgi:cytochrome c-type biogenesis protein CcmH